MSLFKIKLETTNSLNNTACDIKGKNYIDVVDGYIYVSEKDFPYITANYKWLSIEVIGELFEKNEED